MSKIYSGGILLVIMAIYFTLLSLIVSSDINFKAERFEKDGTIYDVDGYEYIRDFGGYCAAPRFKYDPQTLEINEFGRVDSKTLSCSNSPGVQSPDTCGQIEGCNWDTTTSGFWFWKEEYQTCLGTINASYYGIETGTMIGQEIVIPHDGTPETGFDPRQRVTPCDHESIKGDRNVCEGVFGCSWATIQDELESKARHTNVVRTFGSLLSFNHDWGFENPFISNLMTFLLVIIPMLLVIIGIYAMVPFI